MSTLERAIVIAADAHAGQRDKAGAPYILHVLRVMLKMSADDARIAAVLHDVVEDTEWTLEAFRVEGFSEGVLQAIDGLTRRAGEDYDAFIERTGQNDLTRRIKLADLEDNSDLSRLTTVTEQDRERLEKYRRAQQRLSALCAGRG